MTDPTAQPASPLAASSDLWPRLAVGAVIGGRWVVRAEGVRVGGGVVFDATDRRLGGRPCALVAWPDVTADALASAWPADRAPRAPLVDVVDVAGGAIAVVALGDGADRVDAMATLSREGRARLAVDLVDVVARAEHEAIPVTQTAPVQLRATGDPDAPRLLVVPVPRLDRVGDPVAAHHAEERAGLARRVAGWLYGVDETVSPADALERIPDEVRAELGALYADGPDERLEAPLDRDRYARVLGVADAARVPVPTGDPSGPTWGATWSSRARAVARRGWRQVVLACGVVGVVAGVLAPLLGGAELPPAVVETVAADPAGSVLPDAVGTTSAPPPAPVDLTPRAQAYRELTGSPTWYASIGEGPVPVGVTAIDAAFLSGLRGSHAVFTDDDGHVRRVEDYGPFGRFDGWREIERSSGGDVVTVRFFDTTSRLLRTRVVDYAAGRITERLPGGATALGDCAALAVQFDSLRRPVEERCLDRADREISFADGPERVRHVWDGALPLPSRTEYLNTEGAPTVNGDGIAATQMTWDAFGRESVRAFEGLDGQPVPHLGIGAAHVVTTWRAGGVRTTLFDGEQRPIRGPDGWHAEDVSWSDDRAVRRAWFDENRRPVAIRGTAVAVEAMVVGDHGELLERRWLGVDGRPVTDGLVGTSDGVHRYTYVRTDHDDVLRECAWGLDGRAVASAALDGAHCRYLQRDALGRIIAEWRIDVATDIRPDPATGAERTVWTWSSEGVVTRVSWHRADGAPMIARGGGAALRYVWHPATGDRMRQVLVDLDGDPVVGAEGHSEVAWRYDDRGRVIERCRIRTDEGVAGQDLDERRQCVGFTWDSAGRVERLVWSHDRQIGPSWPDAAIDGRVEAVEFVHLGGRVQQQFWSLAGEEPILQHCAADVCVNASGDGPLRLD